MRCRVSVLRLYCGAARPPKALKEAFVPASEVHHAGTNGGTEKSNAGGTHEEVDFKDISIERAYELLEVSCTSRPTRENPGIR